MSVIPVSSVAGAKTYLLTKIRTQANDSKVLVCCDEPSTFQPDDIISVGRIDRATTPVQMVGSGGAGWLEESYTIEVVVSCYRGGDDALAVFKRACALAYVVEAAVRSDPTLGGNVHIAYPGVSECEGTDAPQDGNHPGGRLAEITLHVTCSFRI